MTKVITTEKIDQQATKVESMTDEEYAIVVKSAYYQV
jgi:hypothetical protein